jgi:glycosyltransferase involved in cell wall biosynthesis
MICLDEQSSLQGLEILVLSPTPTYPTDQGNRKRIYSVCQQLRDRGARIHFVHYAQEWWATIPDKAVREMSQQWDSFYIVPPTRPLHALAAAEDHTIDEWWDPAIGKYLQWLFERSSFDVCIVNYTYLSKAFEFVPDRVYRILDTHDKFTDRRQLLENQGISREFFYTTQDQEAIGLERADLVWAIKDEEAEFFSQIASTPVCTLPHIEPQQLIDRVVSPADEDYLVLGMIGARNNINLQNARMFIDQVLPKFHRYLAPIKIKFAGGMCSELQDLANLAGVELIGRVENIEEFYSAIDAVIVPMTFSTGLKIKAVEALATGLPMIAHYHALEGIPTHHPYHQCQSLDEIAEACLDLAFERHLLPALAEATHSTYQNMRVRVERAMDESTFRMLQGQPSIVIVLNEKFFEKWSPLREHTLQSIHYLKYLANLFYYIDTPLDAQRIAAFQECDRVGKIVLSPDAAAASGNIESISYTVSTLAGLCQTRQVICLWLLDVPAELENGISPQLQKTSVYARLDVISCVYPERSQWRERLQLLHGFRHLTVLHCSLSAVFEPLLPGMQTAIVPYWRHLPWQIANRVPERRGMILASRERLPLAYTLWNLYAELVPGGNRPRVFVTTDAETDIIPNSDPSWERDSRFVADTIAASELFNDFESLGRLPQWVIDLTGDRSDFGIYRETLKRIGIAIITPEPSSSSVPIPSHSLRPVSAENLVELLKKLATPEDYLANLKPEIGEQTEQEYGNEAGWASIWREVESLKQKTDRHAAGVTDL